MTKEQDKAQAYWKENISAILKLPYSLVFSPPYGAGINPFINPSLNQVNKKI